MSDEQLKKQETSDPRQQFHLTGCKVTGQEVRHFKRSKHHCNFFSHVVTLAGHQIQYDHLDATFPSVIYSSGQIRQ